MKIHYVPLEFGDVYYNPATHEAVVDDRNGNFLLVRTDEKYDPQQFTKSGARVYEVSDDVFRKLRGAALLFTSAERDLREALSHFPKDSFVL